MVQEPLKEMETSFPEPLLTEAEYLLGHPYLTKVLDNVCSHGNYSLNQRQVRQILIMHVEGLSERSIGIELNINDTLVHRTITTLIQWSKVMPEESSEELLVVTRKYEEDLDAPCLFSTWRNNLWFDKPRDQKKADQFFKAANKHIKYLLNLPDIKVKIACLKDDPDMIVGYSVINKDNLEWVYVKADYRRKGIAKLLSKGIKTISVPATRLGEKIAEKKKLKTIGELNGKTESAEEAR